MLPMNPIFWPFLNLIIRYLLKPFATWIHPDWHPRITGVVNVQMPRPKPFKLKVNPTSYLGKVLFFRGVQSYEWNVIKIFTEIAKHARCFFDVGANIGYYSCIAATHNPRLHIYSFEPLPSAYKYLCENIARNGFSDVTPIQKALSNKVGTSPFYVSHDPAFSNLEDHLTTTGGFNKAFSSRTKLTHQLEIVTDTMDRFWREDLQEPQVDLIKLDTEGSEHLVLGGADYILTHHKPIIFCEVLPNLVGDKIEQIIRKHGYNMYSINDDEVALQHSLIDAPSQDFVFVHPERMSLFNRFVT